MRTTLDIIGPIIYVTYGRNGMAEALAEHLACRIDAYQPDSDERYSRERMVMTVCWDRMPGLAKAEMVAKQIEAALP